MIQGNDVADMRVNADEFGITVFRAFEHKASVLFMTACRTDSANILPNLSQAWEVL